MQNEPSDPVERADERRKTLGEGDVKEKRDGTIEQREHGNIDPSLVPTTGTPEPGGLGWYETLALIRRLAEKKRVVGMDLVEFSKTDNSDAPAFLCAKLIYKSLAYIFREETPKIAGIGSEKYAI